jgi:hypothetical protein
MPLSWSKEDYDNISLEDLDNITEHLISEMGM